MCPSMGIRTWFPVCVRLLPVFPHVIGPLNGDLHELWCIYICRGVCCNYQGRMKERSLRPSMSSESQIQVDSVGSGGTGEGSSYHWHARWGSHHSRGLYLLRIHLPGFQVSRYPRWSCGWRQNCSQMIAISKGEPGLRQWPGRGSRLTECRKWRKKCVIRAVHSKRADVWNQKWRDPEVASEWDEEGMYTSAQVLPLWDSKMKKRVPKTPCMEIHPQSFYSPRQCATRARLFPS